VRLVINRRKRGVKAVSHEPDVAIPVEQVTKDNESEGMVEASSRTTCQRWLIGRAQKGKVSGHTVGACMVSIRMKPGVQYRPTVTENGHTERGNPPSALSGNAGEGNQAVSLGGVGCPKKPMPYCNGEDMLT